MASPGLRFGFLEGSPAEQRAALRRDRSAAEAEAARRTAELDARERACKAAEEAVAAAAARQKALEEDVRSKLADAEETVTLSIGGTPFVTTKKARSRPEERAPMAERGCALRAQC